MSSKSNKKIITDYEETRAKHSKKVIDEADRLRAKAEMQDLKKEEEESNNRLEALRLQKSPKLSPKLGPNKGKKTPSEVPLPQGLETEEMLQGRKKTKNKIKSNKKQAKEAARRKQIEQDIANAKKVSSSISTAPIEQNSNHATFHEEVEEKDDDEEEDLEKEENDGEDENDNVAEEEIGEQEEDAEEEEEEEDDDDGFVIVNSLECVSIDASPLSVHEDLPSPPPLELGEPELSSNKTSNKKGNGKKKGKNKESKRFEHLLVSHSDGSDQQINDKVSKKQAKEAAKARYAAFEARVLPGLVEENPKMKMKDHRAQAAKLWVRSPENPDHPNHKLFLSHENNVEVGVGN